MQPGQVQAVHRILELPRPCTRAATTDPPAIQTAQLPPLRQPSVPELHSVLAQRTLSRGGQRGPQVSIRMGGSPISGSV